MSVVGNVVAGARVKRLKKKLHDAPTKEKGLKIGQKLSKAVKAEKDYAEVQEFFINLLRFLRSAEYNVDVTVEEEDDTLYLVDNKGKALHDKDGKTITFKVTSMENKAAVEIEMMKALIGIPVRMVATAVAMVVNRMKKDPNEDEETQKICEIIETASEIKTVVLDSSQHPVLSELRKKHRADYKRVKITEDLCLFFCLHKGVRSVFLVDGEGKIYSEVRLPKNISKINKSIKAVETRQKQAEAKARLQEIEKLKQAEAKARLQEIEKLKSK